MKKIITSFTLVFFLFVNFNVFSQTSHPFELGFNIGASWQKSDVKMKKLGTGYGLTFGQNYCMNQTSPLLWGWRLRYLNATTFGQDTKRSYGIANNDVLNGTDTALDYYHTSGFVYHNYKTHIDELSLELLLGANKLRERTKFYPYIFGGVGLTKAVARTNQLDLNSKMYNYPQKDSLGTSLNSLYDSTYETLADGNANPCWKFMPSVGIGFSYELAKWFSIGLEHKMTWALNDVLDGQQWSATNKPTGNNDMYHYTSFWLKFSFGRGSKHTSAAAPNNNPTTTNYSTTTSIPAIAFTNPASDLLNVSQPDMVVSGTVTNINTGSDMKLSANGMPVSNFTYNATSHVFSYPATLQSGANTFIVTATNTAGTSNASTTIYYTQAAAGSEMAPVIKVASPAQSPYTTGKSSVTVSGIIQNVSAKNQVKISVNGVETTNFIFNATTHAFSINSNLILGANTFMISASNHSGNDSKTITVLQKQEMNPNENLTPPVITFVIPKSNPASSTTASASVTASVLNVTGLNQITVFLNGNPVSTNTLIFNPATHQLNFKVNMIPGSNSIIVSASNNQGQDSKTQIINYIAQDVPEVIPAPVVTISNPASSPFNTALTSATISGNILNIKSSAQMNVTSNGTILPANTINFNAVTHQFSFNINLIQGSNSIVISASNSSGNDSKTQVINCKQPVLTPAPVITITNPAANPSATTVSTETINATILNISNANQIAVTLNGFSNNTFTYNAASKQFSFNANLIAGANTVVIKASNESGSDTKTQTINYTAPLPPVVTFVSPAISNITSKIPSYAVVATAINVTNASELSVKVNGVSFAGFSFSAITKKITFNVNLNEGINTIAITAATSAGTDSKSTSIKYIKMGISSNNAKFDTTRTTPVVGADDDSNGTPVNTGGSSNTKLPSITLITPPTNNAETSEPIYTVIATVMNVNSNGITVKVNDVVFSAFTYDTTTHRLTIPAPLTNRINYVEITATSALGNRTEIIKITRQSSR